MSQALTADTPNTAADPALVARLSALAPDRDDASARRRSVSALPLAGRHFAVIEDNLYECEAIARCLETAGGICDIYTSAQRFLARARIHEIDAILLDWTLPDLSGDQALTLLRRELGFTGGIVLLADKQVEMDMGYGLSVGADAYVSKPSQAQELIAGIFLAEHKRAQSGFAYRSVFEYAPYRFDLKQQLVYIDEDEVHLTHKEYELALYLFRHLGQIIDRRHVLHRIWGARPDLETRTVDMHMSRLRRQLRLTPDNGFRISSVHGRGYRLERVAR